MIENLATKIFTYFDNLSPKQKALAEILGIFASVILGTSLVFITVHFGLFYEFGILLICYGIYGMLKLIYQSRVEYYETKAHLKDWK